jgi:hypothetical protein
MIISPPFLPKVAEQNEQNLLAGQTAESGDSLQCQSEGDFLDRCLPEMKEVGGFPIAGGFTWHNGVHLVDKGSSKREGYKTIAHAIADGKVKFVGTPPAQPSEDQKYGAVAAGGHTDKGMVIIEHEQVIGANDAGTLKKVKFYSVYMHLAEIGSGIAVDKVVKRKDKIGLVGQVLGSINHLHFEICMDEHNLKELTGRTELTWKPFGDVPTADGRTDAVFGSTYVYLPASTPTQVGTETNPYRAGVATSDLNEKLLVEIKYTGDTKLVTYEYNDHLPWDKRGEIVEAEGEYKLYHRARALSVFLGDTGVFNTGLQGVTLDPDLILRGDTTEMTFNERLISKYYELLRFGRCIGPDPLPETTPHWRKIKKADGTMVWANLNAAGTKKFSDADFLPQLGWQLVSDDKEDKDQRCDSKDLKNYLLAFLPKEEREALLKKTEKEQRQKYLKLARDKKIKPHLRRVMTHFATEWDQATIEERIGWIKNEEEYKNEAEWKKFLGWATALNHANLPAVYKEAKWHFHPAEFMRLFRGVYVWKHLLQEWYSVTPLPDGAANNILTAKFESMSTEEKKFMARCMFYFGLASSKGATLKAAGESDGANATGKTEIISYTALIDLNTVNKPVIFGMRKESDPDIKMSDKGKGGMGLWDDWVTILEKDDTHVVVLKHSGKYNTDPSGQYLDGGKFVKKPSGTQVKGSSSEVDLGRLIADRTYAYSPFFRDEKRFGNGVIGPKITRNRGGTESKELLYNILRKVESSYAERLVYNEKTLQKGQYINVSNSTWQTGSGIEYSEAQTMHFHQGYKSMTGSAGCQTFPADSIEGNFKSFVEKLKEDPEKVTGRDTFQYVLRRM